MPHAINKSLQQAIIYSVFVRNHTQEGTFRALIPDLPRIKALGGDLLWRMPIQPLGETARKGSLGSPYANRDYRAVNPEYGTLEDFEALVDAIHAQGMKCIIDVVYNHTAPDSVLWESHPEWFYRNADGKPGNHVGDWTDIIDLDYTVDRALWDYQIETLQFWGRYVDGFRCDVATFVPVEFWERARTAVEQVRPGCIWLAETVHREFGEEMRRRGLYAATDTEAFAAFDIEYAYDIQTVFDRWLEGTAPLSHYLDLVDFQESVYPRGFNKLRYLENHDTPRIAGRLGRGLSLDNLTAFIYFLKGATLIYAGQEAASDHTVTLFDRDPVVWDTGSDLSPLMERLAQIKHETLGCDDFFSSHADDEHDIAVLAREGDWGRALGVFSLRGESVPVSVDIPDGAYINLIDALPIEVCNGTLAAGEKPVIVLA
ncbi:MAG: hypothetical protein IJI68_13000 [Eggerthellaceae bacterium]|nr:hypothetical protein [Eggerthellaceae bacterium]